MYNSVELVSYAPYILPW